MQYDLPKKRIRILPFVEMSMERKDIISEIIQA
jgi:hypothetical protein